MQRVQRSTHTLAGLGLVAWLVACSTPPPVGGDAGAGSGGVSGASGSSAGSSLGGSSVAGAGASSGFGGSAGTGTGGGVGGALAGTGGAPGGGNGASGAAGTPGGSGSGGSAGGPAGPCTSPGITFCSDFEGAALDPALTFFPEYQRAQQSTYVVHDMTVGHSGSKSVRFPSNDNFSQMLAVTLPGPTFWGRVEFRSDAATAMGHNTYVLATDGAGDPNAGQAIRIGEHQCQLEVNRRTDDAERLSNGGMYMCSGGVVLAPNTWYCLEFFYDGPNSELRVFVDGAEVNALHVTDWGPYTYQLFKFGYERYHGPGKTIWYDDVAIGTQRIGCSGS